MARLPIRLYGDPVLKARAEKAPGPSENLARLAADMFETMDAARGVGLAATQVGALERLIVVSVPTGKEGEPPFRAALVNPEVVATSGQQVGEEGCLSFPGLYFEVKRAKTVKVRAMGLDGKPVEVDGEGYLSRALLHEIDHLDGVLYIDRISTVKRSLLRGKLEDIRRRGAAGESREDDE
ncbi:MAG: peptide deformylase [Candidatus Eisenbacteria bacterium]|nr:peptide deformylase [Candidatus Eisenbacteria bacterium]